MTIVPQEPTHGTNPLGYFPPPANVGTPTMGKPYRCSNCAVPIWCWNGTAWVCFNCKLYSVKLEKADGDLTTLEGCSPSGVYRKAPSQVSQAPQLAGSAQDSHHIKTAQVPQVPAVATEMLVRNGVVNDTHLYMKRDGKLIKKRLPETIPNAGVLLQLCLDNRLDAIWVLAETGLSDSGTQDFLECSEVTDIWDVKNPQYTDPNAYEDGIARCTYVKAWKRKNARAQGESGQEVHIGYAEHNNRWNLDTVTNPVHLLGALTYLEDTLGYPIRYSPSNVGKRLMEAANNNKERLPWVRSVDLTPCMDVVNVGSSELLWTRALTELEESLSSMIAADKNSQFPASCTSAQLGSGEPEYEEFPVIDLKKPPTGVFYLQMITPPREGTPWDGVTLPHPSDGKIEGWFWTYTVKLLTELGYTFSVTEAWIWKETHTILRPWAEDLWAARCYLNDSHPLCKRERYPSQEARELAYGAIKEVLNMSIGLLKHPRTYNRPTAVDLHRPDWNALIVDNARYLMFWRIRSYMKKIDRTPVGILSDCLYYIVSSDDHLKELPEMFDRWDKLGGYKRKYKKAITVTQVKDLFNNRQLDITQINKMLLDYDRSKIEL